MEHRRRFRPVLWVATATVLLGLTMVVVASTAASGDPAPGWSTSATYNAPVEQLSAIACPSATECIAVGAATSSVAAVLATTDGGSTWTSQALPGGLGGIAGVGNLGGLSGVACPTTQDCFAVGSSQLNAGAVISTANAGTAWTLQSLPSGIQSLNGIACPSATECLAVGYYFSQTPVVVATTDGGGTWSIEGVPSGISLSGGIACPSVQDCFAVGHEGTQGVVIATTDAGSAWSSESVPTGAPPLTGVACPTSSQCAAVGSNGSTGTALATTNGGLTWTDQTVPTGTAISQVACSSITSCNAVGSNSSGDGAVLTTANGGTTWSGGTVPSGVGNLVAIACPTSSDCAATGVSSPAGAGEVVASTDGGAAWASETMPFGITELTAVACPSTSQCLAVGTGTSGAVVVTTTNTGSSWTSQPVPAGSASFSAIACPSTSECFAVGESASGTGVIVSTTNAGGTWTDQTVPTGVSWLSALACPSVTECIAVGRGSSEAGVILDTTNAGSTWTDQTVPTGVTVLDAVACPSAADCYAVGSMNDGGVVATTNAGSTWTTQTLAPGLAVLQGIACPSVSDCYAVGAQADYQGEVDATTNGGSTWTSQTFASSATDYLEGIACPTTTSCIAVGQNLAEAPGVSFTTTDGGSAWTSQTVSAEVTNLTATACPSPSQCYAVGSGGPFDGGMILSSVVPASPAISGIVSASGPTTGSTSVTISGTNLASASVTFGGNPATITSDSDATIVAVTPPGAAGSVGVTVTTLGGSATDTGSFTYYSAGLLRVTTSPALPSQITVDGNVADTWGLNWLEIAPGTHTVCFSAVQGYATPACQSVTVTSGATTTVTGTFVQQGFLQVSTSPAVPGEITYTPQGSSTALPMDDWGAWTDLAVGTYSVCFGAVAGYLAPACQSVSVTAGATTAIIGDYSPSTGAPGQSGVGLLRVTTSPARPSQITVDGNVADTWGLNWLEIAPGTHTVCFSAVQGYATPACQSVTVTSGATTTVTGTFVQQGFLQVETSPAVAGTISINGLPADDWGVYTDFPVGTDGVCFGAVSGYTTPACQSVSVAAGTTTTVTGEYVAPPTITGVSPGQGQPRGGTTVVITGTNLSGASGVDFDGLPATGVTVINSTIVEAVTPPCCNYGTVDVSVTTPGGTATAVNAFTYNANVASQADLNAGLSTAEAVYAVAGGWNGTSAQVVADLVAADPGLAFTNGSVHFNNDSHDISINVSADGQVLLMAAQSSYSSCWYAEDNYETNGSNGNLNNATTAPGLSYGSSMGVIETACTASSFVENWGSTYPSS